MSPRAVSSGTRQAGCGRPFLLVFGGIFFLVGSILFWVFFVGPLLRAYGAQNWPSTPCVITSSTIETHHDDDGTSYSPEIRFRYVLDGAELTGSRYSFLEYSGSHGRAKRIVARFPVGRQTICYYDPDNPDYAVLEREVGWSVLIGLFPLIFAVVGAAIIGYGIFGKFESSSVRRLGLSVGAESFEQPPADEVARFEGPQKLRPQHSRWGKLAIIVLVALFWNGIVAVFLVDTIQDPSWFQALFLIPFVLVGLGLIVAVLYQFLSMFNPRVEVALSNGAVVLGETIDVAWQLFGSLRRIQKLTVTIEGIEKATYTRGTSTYTDTNTFYRATICKETQPDQMAFGTQAVQVPADTIHTFRARRNDISWFVRVRGKIARWPDVDESFEFLVKPYADS